MQITSVKHIIWFHLQMCFSPTVLIGFIFEVL